MSQIRWSKTGGFVDIIGEDLQEACPCRLLLRMESGGRNISTEYCVVDDGAYYRIEKEGR